MKIAVSYINSNYNREETIKLIDKSDADYIHVDIMDGKYVACNNIDDNTFSFLKNTNKPLDVHLMVEGPIHYLEALKALNVASITVHPKSCSDFETLLKAIMSLNVKVGIAINPYENVNEFAKYLTLVDKVLIMSVNPGSGGQVFMEKVIPKIDEVRNLNFQGEIGLDGGINDNIMGKLKNIDYVVSGSFICKSNDFNAQINRLKANYQA